MVNECSLNDLSVLSKYVEYVFSKLIFYSSKRKEDQELIFIHAIAKISERQMLVNPIPEEEKFQLIKYTPARLFD